MRDARCATSSPRCRAAVALGRGRPRSAARSRVPAARRDRPRRAAPLAQRDRRPPTATDVDCSSRQRRSAAGVAVGFVALLATRWVLLAVAATLAHDRLGAAAARPARRGGAAPHRGHREVAGGPARHASAARRSAPRRRSSRSRADRPTRSASRWRSSSLRLRQGFRTEDALIDLADGLAHPTRRRGGRCDPAGRRRHRRRRAPLPDGRRARRGGARRGHAHVSASTALAPCTRRR